MLEPHMKPQFWGSNSQPARNDQNNICENLKVLFNLIEFLSLLKSPSVELLFCNCFTWVNRKLNGFLNFSRGFVWKSITQKWMCMNLYVCSIWSISCHVFCSAVTVKASFKSVYTWHSLAFYGFKHQCLPLHKWSCQHSTSNINVTYMPILVALVVINSNHNIWVMVVPQGPALFSLSFYKIK